MLRSTIVALVLASCTAFKAPVGASRPALRHQRAAAVMASEQPSVETEEATAVPETIFTMQERNDGWDDVRNSIKEAKKQREKPWNDIQQEYILPAKRWSSAFVSVASETLEEVDIGPVSLPSLGELKGIVTPTGANLFPSPMLISLPRPPKPFFAPLPPFPSVPSPPPILS